MQDESNGMYTRQRKIKSSLMIKLLSIYHVLNVTTHNGTTVVECVFLQEKIQSSMQLYHFADQLKHNVEKKRLSKIDALQYFMDCYQEVEYFDKKLHSIGYIHGDISTGNILFGTKLSVQVSSTNSTSGITYKKYELVNTTETNLRRCYIIDCGSSLSKRALTMNNNFDDYDTRYAMIHQTFLFAHPFLYTFIAYPEGRYAWKRGLMRGDTHNHVKLTEDASDDVIWVSAKICENYAVATNFLFALERIGIFDDFFNQTIHGRQLADWEYTYKKVKFPDHVPEFETQTQKALIGKLYMMQQLNQKVVADLFAKIQSVEYEQEKSHVEPMIIFMNESMHWHPTRHHFLNRILHPHR